ncbi:VapC toxin family PIN domain ribonuclease, partial [Methylococcaceae bacterium HT2]
MIGIDTNILVRFLVGDDTKQANKTYRLFKKVEDEKTELFVSSFA